MTDASSAAPSGWGKTGIKKVPWLSREDAIMLSHLPPDKARQMEVFLHQQARSDQRFHRKHVTVDVRELGEWAGSYEAQAYYGAGGGRRRHPRKLSE